MRIRVPTLADRCKAIGSKLTVLGVVTLGWAGWGTAAHAYSLLDPAGPQFTEEQRQAQREAGKRVLPAVVQAYRSGAATVRIPAGDYRFGAGKRGPDGPIYALEFSGLRRTAENPLTIDATGVTFWFDLPNDQTTPKCAVGFKDCSHVVLQGATIDSNTRSHIEGRITQLDFANNRIEIELSSGLALPEHFNGNLNQRVVPFKADGRFCAPLYALQSGGVRLTYRTPVAGTAPGRVWIPLSDPALLQTIRQPQWIEAFGDVGVIGVGDGLSCVYSSTRCVGLVNCARLTIRDVNVHVVKGWFSEEGGDGGHRWTRCYFGPRPGTNQWQGGDGGMFNATRHGSTLDQVTIEHSTDDMLNFHGYWDEVAAVGERTVTLVATARAGRLVKAAARSGDRVRFYQKMTGVLAGSAVVTAFEGGTVTLDRPAVGLAHTVVEWEDQQCAGWVVQNCEFRDCYQRLVIKAGPGTVRGCLFRRTGKGVEFNVALHYVEGTVPRGIAIVGNTFEEANPKPFGAVISMSATAYDRSMAPWLSDVTIADNVFRLTGDTAIALSQVDGVRILGNRIEQGGAWAPSPISGQETLLSAMGPVPKPSWREHLIGIFNYRGQLRERIPVVERFARDSILLDRCRNIEVQNNSVIKRGAPRVDQ